MELTGKEVLIMKKFLSSIFVLLVSFALYAQKDVTRFLGIPVDGTKDEMIKALKAEGFENLHNSDEILTGEFNGEEVKLYIVTNRNKVWRIAVADKNTRNKHQIKIRYNRLCQQFAKNNKYIKFEDNTDYTIPDDEDIAEKMSLHDDYEYEAYFFQKPRLYDTLIKSDTATITQEILPDLLKNYTTEELENLGISKFSIDFFPVETAKYLMRREAKHKSVWFKIFKNIYNEFDIWIFYDNLYNQANGEDL